MTTRCRILLLLLWALFQSSPAQAKPEKVTVGYLPMVSSLTYFVAIEKEYFIEEGIDIEGYPQKTSNLIARELSNGNINAAIELAIVPLLQQVAPDKIPFRIFSTSSITKDNGFDSVIVRKGSELRSLADLSGKKVGVFPGTTAKRTFERVFARNMPNLPMPVFETIDPAFHLARLLDGSVDALHAYEPILTLALEERGCVRIAPSIYAQQLSPNPIGVAAVNTAWFNANKKTALAFIRAIDRAVTFIASNPDEARRILAKYTKVDRAIAEKMNIMPMSTSDKINVSALNLYLAELVSMQEIPAVVPVEDICIRK